MLQLPFLVLERHVERLAEVLPQIVTGARLQRQPVLHHAFDRVAAQRPGKLLRPRLHALDHRHRHDVFRHFGVDIQDPQHFLHGLGVVRMRRMPFLPEELRSSQEHARAQFPAHDVGPLVHQDRQIAPALNPLREEMADDGLRSRPDHVRLFQFLAARDGHHGQFRREPFHVLGLFFQETLRNQQREVNVLVPQSFEAAVEFTLQVLPNRVAVGLDDHAALDDLGGFRHISLQDDVLIPGGEILLARCNR